jgi:hypothetical protein
MAMLRSDIEVDLALTEGGGGAGLYASVRVKASLTMKTHPMKLVRRNIALQDFTG